MQDVEANVVTNPLRERIREIATELGGPTALARAAGLAPTSVAQYLSEEKGRASEPGATALVKLARAGGVSIRWLISGEGPKTADQELPNGFVFVDLIDLANAGGAFVHAIINRPTPPDRRILYKYDLIEGLAPAGPQIFAVRTCPGLDFPPVIRAGDIIIIDRPARPLSAWDWSGDLGDLIYLLADGELLKLRRLLRKDSTVNLIMPNGKADRTRLDLQSKLPPNFILFGAAILIQRKLP
jgi:transcriptional regulator with XRE-family HTH domain